MGLAAITGKEADSRVDLANADNSWEAMKAFDVFGGILRRYFEKLPRIQELVLHNVSVCDLSQLPALTVIPFRVDTPQLSTLTRLQLGGSGMRGIFNGHALVESFRNLQTLECVILFGTLVFDAGIESSDPFRGMADNEKDFRDAIASLKSLKELCLAMKLYQFMRDGGETIMELVGTPYCGADVAFRLPKLEVFFLIDQKHCGSDVSFVGLFTTHPTLRVLMLAGSSRIGKDAVLVPARKFQTTAAANPLPVLNVFLGNGSGDNLTFTESAAAKIFRFGVPIQEFFKSREIAEILNGVWVAEMIKQTSSNDPRLWSEPNSM